MSDRLRVGALRGPHGLRGWVKADLKLDDPTLVLRAGPLQHADGTAWVVQDMKAVGQGLVALQLEGITTPEQAARLKGALYLPRAQVPLAEDEVLLIDLVGQPLRDETGETVGEIVGVQDLPAGPALQVQVPARKGTVLVPVDEAFVELSATPLAAVLTDLGLQLFSL